MNIKPLVALAQLLRYQQARNAGALTTELAFDLSVLSRFH